MPTRRVGPAVSWSSQADLHRAALHPLQDVRQRLRQLPRDEEDQRRRQQARHRAGHAQRKLLQQAQQPLGGPLGPRPGVGELAQHKSGPQVDQQHHQQPGQHAQAALGGAHRMVRVGAGQAAVGAGLLPARQPRRRPGAQPLRQPPHLPQHQPGQMHWPTVTWPGPGRCGAGRGLRALRQWRPAAGRAPPRPRWPAARRACPAPRRRAAGRTRCGRPPARRHGRPAATA
jgi:hypothetical protein